MNTLEAIRARRSVKSYDPEHRMSPEEERALFELAQLAPSAFNLQHWRFVVVRDPVLRAEIRKIARDQPQVTDASLFVVLCADLKSWAKEPGRFWSHAPDGVADYIVSAVDIYYRGKPQVERDEAMRSGGLVAQTLMLAAKAMGYDSCPMDGFDFDAMARLIHLPKDHVITLALAIGKGLKEPWPRGGLLPMEDVVITNGFN